MKTVRILGFVVIVIIVLFASTSGFKDFRMDGIQYPKHRLMLMPFR